MCLRNYSYSQTHYHKEYNSTLWNQNSPSVGVHHPELIKHDIIQTWCIHASETVVHCLCHSMIIVFTVYPEILAGIKFADFV